MTIIFLILIVIASFVLGFIVLVQNPKGGGLAGSFAGLSNQFMGVKQTTDVLEKGTWIFAAVIGVLCLASTFFIPHTAGTSAIKTNVTDAPANSAPVNSIPVAPPTSTPAK
jgi:preprotein translocase subunit SecG